MLGAALSTIAATTPQPLYQATGWKAETALGVYSLAPDPYQIVFADATARDQLTPYLKLPALQVTRQVGVTLTVTAGVDTTPVGTCPARHQIVVHLAYRPTGKAGMSIAYPCHAIADGSAWGGHMVIDTEYWTTTNWFSSDAGVNEARRRDTVTHELGHILGLAHPNQDLNGDGTVADGECVHTATGLRPVMCGPNRGNPVQVPTGAGRTAVSGMEAGRFSTEYDLPGLCQLLANYTLRQN
ncbi:hypothetical protein ACWEGQ_00265 [Streptomyces seoulensis]